MSWSTHGERMLPASGDPLMCLLPAVRHASWVSASFCHPACLSPTGHACKRNQKRDRFLVDATCEPQARSHVMLSAIVKRLLMLMLVCRCDVH